MVGSRRGSGGSRRALAGCVNETERRGRRVLVINDTQEILDLFEDILRPLGHDVILLSYAPDELRQIEEIAPDLIIIDFVIGGREYEGWQLLQKLRMNRSTASIPVIACTAAVALVRESEGYLHQQGVTIVMKPFNVDQLETAVASALRSAPAD